MSRSYTSNGGQLQEGGSRNITVPEAAKLHCNASDHQKIYVPKGRSQNPTLASTLSRSLRDVSSSISLSSQVLFNENEGVIPDLEKKEFTGDRGIVKGGNFVNYLPQDEAVAAGLGADEGGLDPADSQRVVDLLNKELLRLLKSSPRDFWREVASDTSLHEFLDSFLKFRARWYDFPHHGVKGTVAGLIVGDHDLSRRVFMVLYRLSSNRDPKASSSDALNSKDHEVFLQETKLLDLPKLLDICAIYGHENENLTTTLVNNAMKTQLNPRDNLTSIVHHFLRIVHTMYQRCISSLEDLSSSGICDVPGASLLRSDFLEVMDFINDAVVSMDSFVTAYKPAAVFFSCPIETSYGNEELLVTLARLHDTLLPSMDRGFRIILLGQNEATISNISLILKMLSGRLVAFGWKLLSVCYLSHEEFQGPLDVPSLSKMFPGTVEDPIIRAEILIQAFQDINGVLLYPQEHPNQMSFLHSLEKRFNLCDRLQSLQSTGWIILDEEQIHYLSEIMMSNLSKVNPEVEMDEDAAILDSKINQIKDLFPDYGNGFLAACLEVYNQNPEEVIQRILEGTLHEDLQCLSTSLEKPPKVATNLSTILPASKDKGKGKMVEEAHDVKLLGSNSTHNDQKIRNDQRENLVGSSTSGRFIRKTNEVSDHYNASRNREDLARDVALSSQYEYEDEYDDSFDDLGLSIMDSGFNDTEIVIERMSSGVGTSSASGEGMERKWGKKMPQYYVKDGKNYSYKVAGSVAVANSREASLVSQVQGELIHGLGRGGNVPLGAVKKLMEYQDQSDRHGKDETSVMASSKGSKGRGRSQAVLQDEKSDGSDSEGGNTSNSRGRGRRGMPRGRSRGSNQYRKDRAFKKHFAGVSGL